MDEHVNAKIAEALRAIGEALAALGPAPEPAPSPARPRRQGRRKGRPAVKVDLSVAVPPDAQAKADAALRRHGYAV